MRGSKIIVFAFLLCPSMGFSFQAQFGISPDNGRDLLISTIESAKRELVINIYQFEDMDIANVVVGRIQAGVPTRMLIEGEPFGQISPEGKKVLRVIQKAMKNRKKAGKDHLFVMTSAAGGKRRFHFDHAKYIVIDGKRLLISSENFSANGFAKSGNQGNRGWQVTFEKPDLARQMLALFKSDTDLSHKDVTDITNLQDVNDNSGLASAESHRSIKPIASESGDVTSVKIVSSPDSLPGITDLLKSARRSISFEFMSLPSTWRGKQMTPDGQEAQSPIVTELIAAAKRGVQVQVLLNDESVFGGQTPGPDAKKKANEISVELLNQIGKCQHLALEGKIVDVQQVQITYIHNKGVLVDGARAFVSSINGTQNSVMDNREIGIVIESSDAADYYGRAFSFDWDNSSRVSPIGHCLGNPLIEVEDFQTLPFLE